MWLWSKQFPWNKFLNSNSIGYTGAAVKQLLLYVQSPFKQSNGCQSVENAVDSMDSVSNVSTVFQRAREGEIEGKK